MADKKPTLGDNMADAVTEEIIRLLGILPPYFGGPLSPTAERIKLLCKQEAARTGEDPFKVLSDCKRILRDRPLSIFGVEACAPSGCLKPCGGPDCVTTCRRAGGVTTVAPVERKELWSWEYEHENGGWFTTWRDHPHDYNPKAYGHRNLRCWSAVLDPAGDQTIYSGSLMDELAHRDATKESDGG